MSYIHSSFNALEHKIRDIQDNLHHTTIKDRIALVRGLRKMIAKDADQIANAIAEECNRPPVEAMMQEVLPVLEMIRYYGKKFPGWMESKGFRYRMPGFLRKKNYLIREPLGPMLILAPSNFPFSLGMMSLVYLFLAGNATFLKLSHRSALVAPMIERLVQESSLAPDFCLSEPGDEQTGEKLIALKPFKKVILFGKANTGEKVRELCDKYKKDYILELGGGVTAVVLQGARIKHAARGIIWSAFYANAGSCAGIRRVIVDLRLREKFITHLVRELNSFHSMLNHWKFKNAYLNLEDVKEMHRFCDQAVQNGCKIIYRPASEELMGAILEVPSHTNQEFSEEIEGPLIRVVFCDNPRDVIQHINREFPSLGLAIWDKYLSHAKDLVKQANVSMSWINETSLGLPALPWGGRGLSGFGLLFSEQGLGEITRLKWVSAHPSLLSLNRFWWYPYSHFKHKLARLAARWFYRW